MWLVELLMDLLFLRGSYSGDQLGCLAPVVRIGIIVLLIALAVYVASLLSS